MTDTYLDPDDTALLEAVLQRPALLARLASLAPKPAPAAKRASKAQALGDSPKQRAAWLRLSPDRQAYLAQWESWRKAWKAARYAGGAEPGPEPFDTTSPEALAQAARDAEYEARVTEFERILNERWGGSLYARDAALRKSANILRSRYKTDAEHAAAVQAHMDAASVVALAEAAKRAAKAEAKAKADAEAKAKADAWDAANPEAAAALAARLAAR
jgi:colicin import membrane protein